MKKVVFLTAAFLLLFAGCGLGNKNNSNLEVSTDVGEDAVSNLTPEEQAALEATLNSEGLDVDGEEGASDEVIGEEETVEEVDPKQGLTEEEIAQAEGRDKQRLEHVSQMQKALEDFYGKNKSYPEKVEELSPDFLAELPKDPESGELYSYTPIGSLPAKHYDILYTLEIGDDEHPAGENVASPELKE